MNYPIKITKVSQSRVNAVDFNNIVFGKEFSDHMFIADYYDGKWQECRIVPYGKMELSPATSTLHYGQAIFEGMKAYKDPDGNPQLFRPLKNFSRINVSAKRMAIPELPEEIFMNGLTELIKLDKDWIPTSFGSSLYIRPFIFAMDDFIGVKPADRFRFMIFGCLAGPYYSKPVKILVSEKYVRAFEGGVGFAKAVGNYGASMLAVKEARELGYDQMLWLDGNEHKYIHESGTMNVFFIIDNKVITPELDGCILDGVTRDSIIQLCRDRNLSLEIRPITISEIDAAADNGALQEAFGTGTAATIAPMELINYKGKIIQLPSSKIAEDLKNDLEEIKISRKTDLHNWVYKLN